MKISLVDPSFFTLPYDQHLADGLASAGMDVELAGRPLRSGETLYPAEHYRIRHSFYRFSERESVRRRPGIRKWTKAFEHLVSLQRFNRALSRNGTDIVHFQWSPMPLVDGIHWSRLRRSKPIVFTVHDTDPFLGNATSTLQRSGWNRLLALAHALIVHTRKSREDLMRKGVDGSKIAVIPHGPLYPVADPDIGCQRSHCARRTILAFGEIKPYKGLDVLLRAAARLPGGLETEWRILVAGRPRMEMGELRTLAEKSAIPVHWRLEYIPDTEIVELFREADVAVFPYRNIDASGVFMMALPFKVPMIATRVGLFQEMLTDEENALLVEPGDETGLASALERLCMDAGLRNDLQMGVSGLIGDKLSWTSIGREHLTVYERATREWYGREKSAAAMVQTG